MDEKGNYQIKRNANVEKLQHELYTMICELKRICEKYDIEFFALYGTAIGIVRHSGFIPWDDDIDIGITRRNYERLKKVFNAEVEGYQLVDATDTCEFHNVLFPRIYKVGTVFEIEDVFFRQRTAQKGEQLNQPIWIDLFVFDYVHSFAEAKRKVNISFLLKKLYIYVKLQLVSRQGDSRIRRMRLFLERTICKACHFLICNPDKKVARLYTKIITREEGDYIVTFSPGMKKDCISSFAKKEEMFPVIYKKFKGIDIGLSKNYEEVLKKTYGNYMILPPEDERKGHAYLRIVYSDGEVAYCQNKLLKDTD